MTRPVLYVCCALLGALILPTQAEAQDDLSPRFGFGFHTTLTTGDALIGLGLRGRGSAPVNDNLSFAIDVGLTGFVLKGRDDATYIFEPQVSAIVTIDPSNARSPYILGGLGGYIPFGRERPREDGGPTIHLGVGWVRALSSISLFFELNPELIIARTSVGLALPVRFGIVI